MDFLGLRKKRRNMVQLFFEDASNTYISLFYFPKVKPVKLNPVNVRKITRAWKSSFIDDETKPTSVAVI